MNDLTYPLLLASLAAIGMVFFLPRDAIFGPLIFAWVGASIAVSLAIMIHYDRANDRVYIEDSLPLFGWGLLCGLLPGFAIMSLYERRPRSRAWIEVLAVMLLFTGVGAMLGTYSGRGSERTPPPEMFRGIGLGAILGLSLGLIQWRVSGSKMRSETMMGNGVPMPISHS